MNREFGYPKQFACYAIQTSALDFVQETAVPRGEIRSPVTTTKWPEADRDTEQLKLRLAPANADAIRSAAKDAGLTISDYLLRLHQQQPLPPRPAVGWKVFDALANLGRAVEAIPNSVRKLDADLGRLSGRLKDLFDANPVNAMAHRDQINAALRAVRNLRAEIMPVLEDLQAANAEPRDAIEDVLAAVIPRRPRD